MLLLAPAVDVVATPLFDSYDIIDIEVRGPFGELVANKKRRPELPFQLTAEGTTHAVELRPAGKSRMKVCSFPMLRVNFDRSATAGSIFDGQNKIRLVTHCRRSNAAQADVLQEYLTYRIFTLLTDVAYRVRLANIVYVDTDDRADGAATQRYGFFLEPKAVLAERLGGDAIEEFGVTLGSLDDDHIALVYVFQYLIANTDWSLAVALDEEVCCHNGNIVEIDGTRYYLPYDFDQAGVVDARHARPDPSLRLRTVTQRRYRGFCMDPGTVRSALREVKSRRNDIMTLVDSLPALTPRDRKKTARYLEKFFEEAEDEAKLLKEFERRCVDP